MPHHLADLTDVSVFVAMEVVFVLKFVMVMMMLVFPIIIRHPSELAVNLFKLSPFLAAELVNGFEDIEGEQVFGQSTLKTHCVVDDNFRDGEYSVALSQFRKFSCLNHVGNDIGIFHRKLVGGENRSRAVRASWRDENLNVHRLVNGFDFSPNIIAQVRSALRDHQDVLNERRELQACRDAEEPDVPTPVAVGNDYGWHFVNPVLFRQLAFTLKVMDFRFNQRGDFAQFLDQLFRFLAELARLIPRRPDQPLFLREQDEPDWIDQPAAEDFLQLPSVAFAQDSHTASTSLQFGWGIFAPHPFVWFKGRCISVAPTTIDA
jgi:hypothetical protein